MKAGLVHVFECDERFFRELKREGLNLKLYTTASFTDMQRARDNCHAAFSDCLVIDVMALASAYRGHSFSKLDFIKTMSEIGAIVKLLEIESQMLCLSERLALMDGLSIADRSFIYWKYLAFLYDFLVKADLEVLVFGGLPHSFFDTVLMELSAAIGIKTFVMQDYPGFPGRCIVHRIPMQIVVPNGPYMALSASSNEYDEAALNAYRSYHADRKLSFVMTKSAESRSRHSIYNTAIKSIREGIAQDVGKYSSARDALEYYDWWSSEGVRKLEDSAKNIVFFLNAEPESTVCPGFDREMYPTSVTLEHVVKRLGEDYNYYIKEHPAMFRASYKESEGYLRMSRSSQFQGLLESLGIRRLHPEVDTYQVLLNTTLVVAPNGSISYEALLHKIPVTGATFSCVSANSLFINLKDLSVDSLLRAQDISKNMTEIDIASELIGSGWNGSPNGNYNYFVKPSLNNATDLAKTICYLVRH